MKIVFISSAFFPSIGGVETHVQAVAKELVRRGHKVTVITEYRQSKNKSNNVAKNRKRTNNSRHFIHKKVDQIDIYYYKYGQDNFFKKFKIWAYMIKDRKRFLDADIIHAHDVFIWYLPLRFLYWNKKVFTTFHGYETIFPPTDSAKLIRKISEKLSYGNIIVGEFIKKWYGTIPDYVMYGGTEKIKSFPKNTVPFRRKKLKILLIGRLEKDIGILVYRDALRILKEKGFTFDLTICGEGSLKPEIESYGTVQGFIRDLKSSIRKADVVFSSSYLTMLQVLQLGKPVFTVYTNPLKHDYLRNSPFEKFITISGNAWDLSSKIARFQPNIRKIADGSRWANTQTWESVTDTYLKLWQK